MRLPSQMYRLFFEYASDAILTVEVGSFRIQMANRRLEEMTGHSISDLVGASAERLFPGSERAGVGGRDFSPAVLGLPGLHEDIRMLRADDHFFFASVAVGHIPGDDGLVAVCMIRDETERRLLERELITKHAALRQAHEELLEITAAAERRNRELVSLSGRMASLAKQAAVGAFTAGVAHSINNPLAALVSACRRTQKLLASGEDLSSDKARERLDKLLQRKQEAAQRIQNVLLNVRRIHRGGGPRDNMAEVDLKNELMTALELFEHRLDGVTVVRRFGSVPKVAGFPDELQYLFCNIIDNALMAMGHNGTLEFDVNQSGDQIRVAICDSGPGIAPEVAEGLFDPFVTTRHDGTGLGLSIARRIAQHHHGRLYADRECTRGARFVLEIPNQSPTGAQVVPEEASRELYHGF